MVSSALLSCLLVVSLSGILTHNVGQVPFHLVVTDNQHDSNKKLYLVHNVPGGTLLGAMTRLAKSTHSDFTFTISENIDYGAYLESVNGLFGNKQDHTYWELMVQLANKTIISSNVGISCYIPQVNEMVILKYSKW